MANENNGNPGNQNPIHQSKEDTEIRRLDQELADRVLWAKGEGRFLVAIFALEERANEPGKFNVAFYGQNRKFPIEDFNHAGRMLRDWLQTEVSRIVGAPATPVELPLPPEAGEKKDSGLIVP